MNVVPGVGVEPTRGKSPRDFKSRTSAIPSARHPGSNPSLLSVLLQDNHFGLEGAGAAVFAVRLNGERGQATCKISRLPVTHKSV